MSGPYLLEGLRVIDTASFTEERDWPLLLRALGQPALGADPRFATTAARRANARTLTRELDQIFAGRPLAEWRAALDREGLTFGFVGTVEDARHDAQMVASGALVPIDDPRAGAALTVSSPLWIEGEAKVPARYAPELGEQSSEILAEVGYTDEQIGRLIADGVVVQDKPALG